MGPLRNHQREQFVLFYVQGKTQAEAYQRAGYNVCGKRSAEVCAQRLLRDVEVRRRIQELQKQNAESTDVTVAALMVECANIQRQAMQRNQLSAAVAALTAKAKIAGLWVERTESENVNLNYVISDSLPTEQQWEEERAQNAKDVTP